MAHTEVLKQFEKMFPVFAGIRIKCWFPNGKNSIRIRHNNGLEYVFTFHSITDWKLETQDSFLKTMGGKRNG